MWYTLWGTILNNLLLMKIWNLLNHWRKCVNFLLIGNKLWNWNCLKYHPKRLSQFDSCCMYMLQNFKGSIKMNYRSVNETGVEKSYFTNKKFFLTKVFEVNTTLYLWPRRTNNLLGIKVKKNMFPTILGYLFTCTCTHIYNAVSYLVFILTSNWGGTQKAKQSNGAFSASWRVCGRCWFNVSGRSKDEVPPIINIVPIIMSGRTNMSVPCKTIRNTLGVILYSISKLIWLYATYSTIN